MRPGPESTVSAGAAAAGVARAPRLMSTTSPRLGLRFGAPSALLRFRLVGSSFVAHPLPLRRVAPPLDAAAVLLRWRLLAQAAFGWRARRLRPAALSVALRGVPLLFAPSALAAAPAPPSSTVRTT